MKSEASSGQQLSPLWGECIRRARTAPFRFDEYMGLCLYHPEHGYYRSGSMEPGRQGDFYTSVSVGPVFGRLLAGFIASIWKQSNLGEPLVLMEQGAHAGQLARDILDCLRDVHPELYETCEYRIVEPAPQLAARQQNRLAEFGSKVRWYEGIAEMMESVPAAFFLSNELVDSFPVRWIRRVGGVWTEAWVTSDPEVDGLELLFKPIADDLLLEAIRKWELPEIEGYNAEINTQAAEWIRELGQRLPAGYILTMDYGFDAGTLYHPERAQGTLTCYHEHRRDDFFLDAPGEKDMTSHVNFSELIEEGAAAGLECVFFQDQHHALVEMARDSYLPELEKRMLAGDPLAQKEIMQFKTLMHPGLMGTQFHFLLQKAGKGRT